MTIYRLAMAVLLTIGGNAIAQTSLWVNAPTPNTPQVTSTAAVTLGVKFYSDVPGSVTGVRFFKGTANTGTHTGALWSSTGARLATVTFSGETASGWQQANFSSPITIAANTIYVVSYTAPNGSHAHDAFYPWSTLSSGPLHTSSASPGVFTYGSGVLFPSNTWQSSNYYVDVVFSPAAGQTSFWNDSATPAKPQVTSTAAITLGLKFYSDVTGSITGVRFYKGTRNTGTHTGALWSSTGARLATVTFSGETASGWQQANFSSPITIAANTIYVVSYTAPNGSHAHDQAYPWASLNSGSLHASGTSPGVHTYGSGVVFPANAWNSSNYYVDVVFMPSSTPPQSSTYTISGTVSGSTATLALSGASVTTATTNSSGTYSFAGLSNGTYVITPTQPGYTFTPASRTVTVNSGNVSGITFTASAVPSTTTYTISGTVSGSTATVTLSGTRSASTTTDASGNYSFASLPNGSYVVAPTRSGYTFTPSTRAVTINGANVTGVNFTGTVTPTPVPRTVELSWAPSSSPSVSGYNIYRAAVSGGTLTKVNSTLISAAAYMDNNVESGRTYYYVATAVDSNNVESAHSNQAAAYVPAP